MLANCRELSNIGSWSDDVLHKIVTQFIAVRFPVYLVLNKADTPAAVDNIIKYEFRCRCTLMWLLCFILTYIAPGDVTQSPKRNVNFMKHIRQLII